MALCAIAVLLAGGGCQCCVAPRASKISMGAKKRTCAVSRREVLDGSSLTRQFYDPDGFRAGLPPGWSPALVLSLGAAAATYGNSKRSKLFSELRELGAGGVNKQGKASHLPIVTLTPGRTGQVSVEITAPVSTPDAIDYIWVSDADTGEIFEGRRFLPRETPSLVLLVARGRRIVPSVHSTNDGVWEGEAVAVVDP